MLQAAALLCFRPQLCRSFDTQPLAPFRRVPRVRGKLNARSAIDFGHQVDTLHAKFDVVVDIPLFRRTYSFLVY